MSENRRQQLSYEDQKRINRYESYKAKIEAEYYHFHISFSNYLMAENMRRDLQKQIVNQEKPSVAKHT